MVQIFLKEREGLVKWGNCFKKVGPHVFLSLSTLSNVILLCLCIFLIDTIYFYQSSLCFTLIQSSPKMCYFKKYVILEKQIHYRLDAQSKFLIAVNFSFNVTQTAAMSTQHVMLIDTFICACQSFRPCVFVVLCVSAFMCVCVCDIKSQY